MWIWCILTFLLGGLVGAGTIILFISARDCNKYPREPPEKSGGNDKN